MSRTISETTIVRKNGKKHLRKNKKEKSNKRIPGTNDFYHALSDNSNDVIFRAHHLPTWGYDYVSPSATHVTGYTPEEFYANPNLPMECILPEDLVQLEGKLEPGNPSTFDPIILRWKHKDGRVIWTEQFISINRNKDGVADTCLVIARDVTERVLADKTLQTEKNKLLSVIDAMADGLTIQDRDFNIIYQNEPAKLIYGGDHVGEKCYRIYENRDTVCEGCPVKLAFKDGKSHTSERKSKSASGETIFWEITANPIRDAEGKVVSCIEIGKDITERKRMEKELADEATRRRILVEQSRDGIVILDQNGKVYEANRRFAEMLGYTPEEVLKLDVWDWEYLYPPEQVKEMIRTVTEEGDHFETKHRRKDGSTYDVEISTNGAIFASQKLIFCVCRDITERKKAEAKLQESQMFSASLLENAPHATMVINPDTSVRYVNPAWERINGWILAEVIGMKAPYPWWPEELREDFLKGFMEAIKQDSGKGEVVAVKKNGEQYWIDMVWATVKHNGELQYLLINSVDITERKLAEEKRQAILKTALDGFYISDLEGKFLEVNDSYCDMTGYTQEELLKMSVADVEALENLEQITRHIKEIVKKGSGRFETQHRCKDGRMIDIEINAKYPDIGEEQVIVFVRDITEHKAAEKAIQESEEKFSKAFHASPGSISISRVKDGTFIEVNESFLRDKGYTREEVIGHRSFDLRIWADEDISERMMASLRKGKGFRNEVVRYRTKSGFIRTGLVSADLINIGNEPCLIVLNNDITQQKQAEEQLRLLSSVTQQVSDSIFITDPNFRITYMNQAAEALFGYTIDELRGKNLMTLDHAPPAKKTLQETLKVVSKGSMMSKNIKKKRKDGSLIICDCRLSPLYDENNQVCAFIDVQRDVTEQKDVEAKLKAQKKLIENILATMPEGVLVIDKNDRVILANESFHKIFHRSQNTVINKLLKSIIPTDQLFNLYRSVKLGKKETGTLEFRYRARNYEKIIVCVAIKMDGARTLLTFTDVSREREEEEKLYLTDRLASIGEMATGLAHELNNPLTGILSLSQLLIDSDIPEEPKEDLHCINSEAKRAASIVKNVLLFTRNNNYENGQASVNEVVQNVLRLREYEEKANNIEIITNLDENLPEISIDKFQLQQVFLNIILNAEAAIKDAGRPGRLTITTERANNHIYISFNDNGCGINKHVLPRIFDPFFTTKDIGKGTGLGLSICYGIVVKHGGKITVKTRGNKGATFTVKMPVAPPVKLK